MAASLNGYGDGPLLVNSRGGDQFHASIRQAVESAGVQTDLAVLCVPASACGEAIEECAAAGVGAALICAGGFAEAGGEGITYQRRVVDAAKSTGVRVLGPNTSGFFIPRRQLLASFVPGVAQLAAGSIAVVAASGGVNHAVSFALERRGLGVSLGVGIGTGLDVTAPDVLEYLATDDDTRAIILHIESVPDGPRLLAAVRAATSLKPVVALVVGRHDLGEFATSHTGALATSWRTACALLQEAGAMLALDEDDLVTAASTLSVTRLKPSPRSGVAVVTAQAGPGMIVTDALHGFGVSIPQLSGATQSLLATLLPPLTFQANPVDTGRPGPRHSEVVRAVAHDPEVDVVAVYGLTEPVVDLPRAIAGIEVDHVRFVLGLDGPTNEVEAAKHDAQHLGLPVVIGAKALATAIRALVDDSRLAYFRQRDDEAPCRLSGAEFVSVPKGAVTEGEAKRILRLVGIDTPQGRVCQSLADAEVAAGLIGWPVAVKISDASITHKTETGGVHLGIRDTEQLGRAVSALRTIGATEFLVEAMAPPGVDLVVGARRDPVFGPIVILGVGGIATEVYSDVAVASVPSSVATLLRLPEQLAAQELLGGHRGAPVVDREAVARVCELLGDLLLSNPHIVEVEINPLRAHAGGLLALDAVVSSSSSRPGVVGDMPVARQAR